MFVEFMTELRRPMDFFKAMCEFGFARGEAAADHIKSRFAGCAQAFILVVYLWYGLFIYAYQGQFSMSKLSLVEKQLRALLTPPLVCSPRVPGDLGICLSNLDKLHRLSNRSHRRRLVRTCRPARRLRLRRRRHL